MILFYIVIFSDLRAHNRFLARFAMALDILRVESEDCAQLVRDRLPALVRRIDMHAEEVCDLSVIPILKVVLGKDQPLLVRKMLEKFRACLAVNPCVIRKPLLVLVHRIFDSAIVVHFGLLAILDRSNLVVEIRRILLVLLDMTGDLVFEKIVNVTAKAASYILVALCEREEDDAEIIINLFLILMTVAFYQEIEFRRDGFCRLKSRILAPERFLEMELRHEKADERALFRILEVDLAALQKDDIFLEKRMEPFQKLHASTVCVDLFEFRRARLELRLICEDEIVDLLPFVRMLVELVDVVPFAFVDDAEDDHPVGEVLGLVRIFDDNGVDLCFFLYGKRFFPISCPAP